MSTLITDRQQIGGTMRRIERVYREPSGSLGNSAVERYVKRCAAATEQTAGPIIRSGLANGWRFLCLLDFQVQLWAPASWKPITYTMQNAALWRAIKNRGVSLT